MSLISRDLALRAAGLASSLTLIETVLAYSTGYVPIENFPWIVAASLLVALVALAVEAVVSRLRPDHWATVSAMPLTPVFLFAMRGQTDPTQIDVAWAFPVRVVATVALALLVLWMLKRRNPSPRRLALIQFFAVTISALLFLVRTVRLSALSLVQTVTVTTVREDVGNIGTDWAAVIVAAGAAALAYSWGFRARRGALTASLAVLALAGAYALGFCSRISEPPQALRRATVSKKPNIVLIVLDTARRDAFSVYGSTNKTPGMDEFAKAATVFTRAYTTGTYSLPGHASLFSGLLPSQHGAHTVSGGGERALDPTAPVIAEELQARGYRTLGFSANPAYLAQWTGLQRGFGFFWLGMRKLFGFWPTAEMVRRRFAPVEARDSEGMFWPAAAVLPAARRAFLSEPRPAFLFVNVMDAHRPYPQAPPSRDPVIRRAQYARAVAEQDLEVWAFLKALRGSPDWDRALVVVTADHGEFLGEHGGRTKHAPNPPYEEVLRIPLVVKFPQQAEGRRSDDLVTLADVKSMVDSAIDQRPWTPQSSSQPRVVAESWWEAGSRVIEEPPASRAIFFHDHKLIEHRNGVDELFDLAKDPGEETNLLATNPRFATGLKTLMLRSIAPLTQNLKGSRLPAQIPPDVLETMRSLGYIK